MLGFEKTTRLTIAQHLGVEFLDGKRTYDEPSEFYFLERGRESVE